MIQFNKKLDEISYIVGFDLALYRTGVCLYDVKKQKFINYQEIEVRKNSENPILDLYNKIKEYFKNVKLLLNSRNIMVVREALPQQCGIHSTINTLQQLAKAHAILDLCIAQNLGVDEYNESGVHTVSVKAFFRSEAVPKPQKEDIRRALVDYYNIDNNLLTDNISDAMAVVHILVHQKWNKDIDEEIKNIKKEIKKLKRQNAIEGKNQEIERLKGLKI